MYLSIKKEKIKGFINDKTTQATEIEIIRLILNSFKEDDFSIAYDTNEKRIYFYDNVELYWKSLEVMEFAGYLYKAFSQSIEELIPFRSELYKESKSKTNYFFALTFDRFKKIVIAITSIIPKMTNIKTPDYIPLKNGYIDLKTLDFKKPDKRIYNRYTLPFEYKEGVEQPKMFLDFLEQIQPVKENREFLINWLAYMLIPSNPRQKALFLMGDGSNGKGVLTRLMTTILGKDNTSSLTIPQINVSSYEMPHLRNKLVNFSPDNDPKDQLHIGTFKSATGGDNMMVRVIGKDPFEMTYYGKLVFSVNQMPYFKSKDPAVLRRPEVLQFTVIVPEKNRVADLEEKILKDGGSAVFMYLLNRARELATNNFKFTAPVQVAEFTKSIVEETDNIHNFVCELLETEDNGEIVEFSETRKKLYSDFKDYCLENGFKLPNINTFKTDLENYFKKRNDWKIEYKRKTSGMSFVFEKHIPF